MAELRRVARIARTPAFSALFRVVELGAFAIMAFGGVGATTTFEGGVAHAQPATSTEQERRAKVAVRVGSRAVTVGELEDRMASVPPFQARTFGATRDEIVHTYVDQVILRDLLLGAGAEQRGLDKKLPTSHQLARARSTATLRALRALPGSLASPASVSEEDVRRYYDANRSHFDSPERINLWRILVKSRQDAESILATAKADPQTQKWNDIAREKSIDKATNFRGGNLGFVAADGTSNEAGLKIDPTLVAAASKVKDGEFVAQPVAEGDAFAIVWRRGTVPANKRTLEEAAQQIRTTIFRERTEAAEKKLIDELRAKNVKKYDPDPLKIVVLPAFDFDGGVSLPRSVPQAPKAKAPSP